MTLAPWPHAKHRKLTPAAVRMIRDGWVKAKAAGWFQKEWCEDVGAMLGLTPGGVAQVIQRRNWRGEL